MFECLKSIESSIELHKDERGWEQIRVVTWTKEGTQSVIYIDNHDAIWRSFRQLFP